MQAHKSFYNWIELIDIAVAGVDLLWMPSGLQNVLSHNLNMHSSLNSLDF